MPDVFSNPLEILNPPFQNLETGDYPGATSGQIEDPTNANPIGEGEWLDLASTSPNTGKLARATATVKNPFLYVGQVGRTDIQTTKKGPIAFTRPHRIKTKLVSGASSLVAGDEVMIGNVTVKGQTKAGLVKATGSGNYALGFVLAAGANSGDPDGSYWEIFLYNQSLLIP